MNPFRNGIRPLLKSHVGGRLRLTPRVAAAALFILIVPRVGWSAEPKYPVTREIRDGSGIVRSVTLSQDDVVILRNFAVGQPLRYSYCLNFPWSDAHRISAILTKFIEIGEGAQKDDFGKRLGHIGTVSVTLAHTDEGNAPVLKLPDGVRNISITDARQLLRCISMLPEMHAERSKSDDTTSTAPVAELIKTR